MREELVALREATRGTPFEGDLFLVGGFVRDELAGRPESPDVDLVTTGSVPALMRLLRQTLDVERLAEYPRFGTAACRLGETNLEFVEARRESYRADSRKPSVEPATLEEDAARRDLTVNALLRGLHDGELRDPTGLGLADLRARLLRTPREPAQTFRDDPLRMLRVVRFRAQLGFEPVPGLYAAIEREAGRLDVVSAERIRDELVKMLGSPRAAQALGDLLRLGLLGRFAPELAALAGVEQGRYHHLDVWDHSLLVLAKLGPEADLPTRLAALLHDVGKPPTRTVEPNGDVRFFGHEVAGAELAATVLRRLKFSGAEVAQVARLVKGHMRLGSAPEFSASAARRLLRDLGPDVPRLLALVEADTRALRPGVRTMDLDAIRARLAEAEARTPPETLRSPLDGEAIQAALGLGPGPEVGAAKRFLLERVLEGELDPADTVKAELLLRAYASKRR